MFRTILCIGLLCLVTRPCYGFEVTFKEVAAVDSVTITLGDVADFDAQSETTKALATKTVAQSGQPGQDITLDASALIQHLTSTLELPSDILWSGAASIKVHRNAITVGPDKIQQILDEYFDSRKGDMPVADTRFIVDDLPIPFTLPAGDLKWEIFPSNPDIIKSSRFSLIFKVDGQVRKNMSLRGHFEAMAPVAVASVQMEKGTLFDEKNLTMETRDITQFTTPCLNPSDLAGKILTRTIKAGSVIELSTAQAPPLVKKGEVVKIILNQGNIFLSTLGIAKANGAKDETIRVQNMSSNKILFCRVSAAGLVEVAL